MKSNLVASCSNLMLVLLLCLCIKPAIAQTDSLKYSFVDTTQIRQLLEEAKELIGKGKNEEINQKLDLVTLILSQTIGKENRYYGDLLHLKGRVQISLAHYDKAIEFTQSALEIRQRVLGPNHPEVAASLNNLGVANKLKGDFDAAVEFYQKSLVIRKKYQEHFLVISNLNNLGAAYNSKHDYENAIKYYQEALDICLESTGLENLDVASSYYNLGTAFHDKGDYDRSIEYYHKLLDIRLKLLGPEHLDVADSYNNLSDCFEHIGEYVKAIEFEQKALDIRLKLLEPNHLIVASSYNSLGYYYFRNGEFDKSIYSTDKAITIRTKILDENNIDIAHSYNNSGLAFNAKGDYEKAIELYEKSLAIRLKLLEDGHPDIAVSLNNLGDSYYYKGEYTKAIGYFENSLAIRLKKFGNKHPDIAQSYYNLAYAYDALGELTTAINYFKMALDIQLSFFGLSHPYIGDSYDGLGNTFISKGDYKAAIKCFEKSLNIRIKTIGIEHPQIALSFNNIGHLYDLMGEYDRAIEYFEKSLNIEFEKLGADHLNLAFTYNNLGSSHISKESYDKAYGYYSKALSIRLKYLEPRHPDIAVSYNNLGDSFYFQSEYKKAIEYYQKALDIRLEKFGLNHIGVAQIFYNIAYAYFEDRIFDEAIEFFNKALEIRLKKIGFEHPDVAYTYEGLGISYKEIGEYGNAVVAFTNALKACKYQPENLHAVNSIVALIGPLKFSSETLEKQYALSPDPSLLTQSLTYAQEALAVTDFQSSSFSSESSKTHWQSIYHPFYEQAIDISLLAAAVNHNDTLRRQTFTYAEKSKATQLQAQLKNADALAFSGIPDSLTQKEYELRIDISWREKQRQALLDKGKTETDSTVLRLGSIVFDLRQQYDSLKTRFEKNYPAYYRLKYDLSTVPLQYVQDSLLQPGQTLLEYFVGDSSIYIFLVQPKNYQVIEVKKDSAFEQWVEDLTRNGIYGFYGKKDITKGKSINNYGTSAHQLYQTLIAPVKAKLGEKLIIIPDGILGYVPFEALLTEKPPRPDAIPAYKYLIQDHQISYCYSATLLKEMRNKKHRQEPTQKLLAMAPFFLGNADTLLSKVDSTELLADVALRDTLAALPNSGTEVASISKILKGQAFYGKEATLQKFQDLAPRYRILHLSTHGKADDRLGDYAYLAFGMPNAQGTFDKLYARDLYNLSLNADLVVLSACETGIGKLQRGEGIVSLARAFAYAGAKSIVTTLWKVSDEQSKNLMTSFYKYLSKGKAKDEALRQAKLDFLQKNEKKTELLHPFFWASFIGIGDMDPMK